MIVPKAVEEVLSQLHADEEQKSKVMHLSSVLEKKEIFQNAVQENKNYILASFQEEPEFNFIQNNVNENGIVHYRTLKISESMEEKRKRNASRKRKSRAKKVEKNGVVKTNREWESEKDKVRKAAKAAEKKKLSNLKKKKTVHRQGLNHQEGRVVPNLY